MTLNSEFNIRRVEIPALSTHEGIHKTSVKLYWICPICAGPRGPIFRTQSYDGSRKLECDGWENPCGHIDKYDLVISEAKSNQLN